MRFRPTIVVAVCLPVLLIFFLQNRPAQTSPPTAYDPPLQDYETGQTLQLSSLGGKGSRIALFFFCGCGYCRETAADLPKWALEGHSAIVMNMATDEARSFRKDVGWSGHLLMDAFSDIAKALDARSCPTVVVVDDHGRTIFHSQERNARLSKVTLAHVRDIANTK
jgi:hypothetical protein